MGAANRQSPLYLENLWLCTTGRPRLGSRSPASYEQSLFLVFLIEEEKRAFKVCEVRTSGLYSQVCFLSSNKFFECKHPFIDKTDGFFYQNEGKDMTISQPSSILYPGNKQYKFVKSLSCLCQNRTSERKL